MEFTELDLQSLGLRIRHHRIHKRLTQQQLVKLIDGKSSQITQFERGGVSPSLPALAKLAKVFNTSIDYWLTGRTTEPAFQGEFNSTRFHPRLKELRKWRGYRLKEAAEALGCLNPSLYLYERGETLPPLKIIHRMTQLYDCTADFLVSGASIKDPLDDLFQPEEDKRNEIVINFIPEEHDPVEQIQVLKTIVSLRKEQLDYKMKLAVSDREAMLNMEKMEELYMEHAELDLMGELSDKLLNRYQKQETDKTENEVAGSGSRGGENA